MGVPKTKFHDEASLGMHVFASSISNMVGRSTATAATNNSLTYFLHHFEQISYATLSSPKGQQVFKEKVPSLIYEYPFVLHSIIAYSANHLRYLGQDDCKIYLTAAFHTRRALQMYSKRLNQSLDRVETDAMFAACLILTGLSFVSDKIDPNDSWIIQQQHDACRWITTASGVSIFFRATKIQGQIDQSIWKPFLLEARTPQGQIEKDAYRLPTMLLELCGFDEPINPYTAALQVLGSIMEVKPNTYHFPNIISFPSRMQPEFVKLVYQKDDRALLIVGYWFALMCQVTNWWCLKRVRSECLAICLHLNGHEDTRINTLLNFPKKACGFTATLKSLYGSSIGVDQTILV